MYADGVSFWYLLLEESSERAVRSKQSQTLVVVFHNSNVYATLHHSGNFLYLLLQSRLKAVWFAHLTIALLF